MRRAAMALSKTLLAALLASGAAALEPIVIKGSKFFYENGTQFFIKGIAYQQDTSAAGGGVQSVKFVDPLANPAACRRDVPLLKQLGTNAIRTYAIDAGADHSVCMGLLEDAGIYVISDLGEPLLSIETDSPAGTFTTNKTNTPASAYVKAAVRDTKAYVKEKGLNYYVGYAANDDPDVRRDIAHYFNCGDDQTQAIDFWGYNIYQWCGESTLEKSGYSKQIDFFKNYSVPVFFAEYGCNKGSQGAESRIFQETTFLYADEMSSVFSGGIVYMYFQEANDYGLVELNGNIAKPMKNFDQLKSRISKVDPTLIDMDKYTPSNVPQECPPVSENWAVSGDRLPPTPDDKVCECMVAGLSCKASPSLDEEDYADIFDFICGTPGSPCAGINGNTTTGKYGAFSMCTAEQKLGYVLDRYYKNQNNAASACDFSGQATIVTPTKTDSECKQKLSEASQAANAGGSGSSSSNDDDDSSAITMVATSVYGLVAFIVGALVML
ncbi:unnamed protein product [Parascedosporium putredinis]|uniref:1,3-beta-glucanosyltransferase n=1 Tax=Parascedosporium putredinis TaxID=1442378 RepID=A0A9P1GZ13_9PEZI|nr:unnamed protein product [Parascedosporium putredinis]CAI7991199.1 unnamed protein product [Parascedosporium putredinis]